MNFTKLIYLRNLARRFGITRLLSIKSRIANRRIEKYYSEKRPAFAEINLSGFSYRLNTNSAYEWMRANAVYQDKKIIDHLLERLQPGMDCWDIGASIGAYSCILSFKNGPNGSVYAFEPENGSRKKLAANIALNSIGNIIVYDVALGKEEANHQLALAGDTSAGTHRIGLQTSGDIGTQTVHVTSADHLIKRHQLKIPGVMKIDVEGFEEQVLLGALNTIKSPFCKAIMIEIHFSIYDAEHDNQRLPRIINILKASGFTNLTWVDASHLLATK